MVRKVHVEGIPIFNRRFHDSGRVELPQIHLEMDGTTFTRLQMSFLRQSSHRPGSSTCLYPKGRRRYNRMGEKGTIGDRGRNSIWQDRFWYGLFLLSSTRRCPSATSN